MRSDLAAIVRADSRLELTAETSPSELARIVATFDPDVVIEQSENGSATVHVPSVTLVSDPRAAWEAERLDSGRDPHAILYEDATPEQIAAATAAVAAGLIALQPRAFAFSAAIPGEPKASAETLTRRERDVLRELARGAANKAVATRLDISEHTVKFHVASIFAKLGAASRTEAVAQGIRLGLIMV